MTKKIKQQTIHIKLLSSEGEQKINELIKLGMIEIDTLHVDSKTQIQELKEFLKKEKPKMELYLKQTKLEINKLRQEFDNLIKRHDGEINIIDLQLLEEWNKANKDPKNVN